MKINSEWTNYSLLASGNGEKLECFDKYTLLRPDPQVIWDPPYKLNANAKLTAIYSRSATGGGNWQFLHRVPDTFNVNWRNLKFELKLMGFKHIGIFPEQAVNWARMIDSINNANRPISVLNLFAYTGGATIACLSTGAKVCHVDAAKSMCEMAKKNMRINNLNESNARFIVEDCLKFVEREIRRGNTYDAIIMDPPSYGRGPNGEMWKIENSIFDLVKTTRKIISKNPLFYLINSYTTGLQPTVMKNILDINFKDIKHAVDADEIGILGEDGITLPCGCSAYMTFNP
ncbi:MAG TPA: class I SAM-dependent methyltransferase [Clostridia bacterium]|nr:class I SAM-dependent methyltransferase [Clostridia bacterium]